MTLKEVHTRLVNSEREGVAERVDRLLPFLDTRLIIKDDVSIKTKVFRKDTHTHQYLHLDSNHPLERERGRENSDAQSEHDCM